MLAKYKNKGNSCKNQLISTANIVLQFFNHIIFKIIQIMQTLTTSNAYIP